MVLLPGCACCVNSCAGFSYKKIDGGGGTGTTVNTYSFPLGQHYVRFHWRWTFLGSSSVVAKYSVLTSVINEGVRVLYDSGEEVQFPPEDPICIEKPADSTTLTVTVTQTGLSSLWAYDLDCGACPPPNPLP
jgi:hypothetical protein